MDASKVPARINVGHARGRVAPRHDPGPGRRPQPRAPRGAARQPRALPDLLQGQGPEPGLRAARPAASADRPSLRRRPRPEPRRPTRRAAAAERRRRPGRPARRPRRPPPPEAEPRCGQRQLASTGPGHADPGRHPADGRRAAGRHGQGRRHASATRTSSWATPTAWSWTSRTSSSRAPVQSLDVDPGPRAEGPHRPVQRRLARRSRASSSTSPSRSPYQIVEGARRRQDRLRRGTRHRARRPWPPCGAEPEPGAAARRRLAAAAAAVAGAAVLRRAPAGACLEPRRSRPRRPSRPGPLGQPRRSTRATRSASTSRTATCRTSSGSSPTSAA